MAAMDTNSVVVLIVGLLEFGCSLVILGALGLIYWTIRTLEPRTQLEKRLGEAELAIFALGNQVTRLRTSKAGKASAEKKRQQEAPEEDDDDAFLQELAPADRALWLAIPKEQRLKAQVD